VINLQADGSALYTAQALWTQAGENLNVTTVILSNRSYAILHLEMERVRANTPGRRAAALLDLSMPDLDFVHLAQGLGLDAMRATTAEEFSTALQQAASEPGPFLIHAVVK
jgi:acetolactate synthase-1/2/3 large subunit